MKKYVKSKLNSLNNDYSEVRGQPFDYFFCPILLVDEDTSLCKAHIVNKAFPNSSRKWTIQRKDVDNFYGSNFEADFIGIQHAGKWTPSEVFNDKSLIGRLSPKFEASGKAVDFYISRGETPKHHTRVDFDDGEKIVPLSLKIPHEEFIELISADWDIVALKDLRLAAVVSLLKTAHLSLFYLLGYRYALSPAGIFIGKDILGKFFLDNVGKSKNEIQQNACSFFREFVHMVRPVAKSSFEFKGTLSDRVLILCGEENSNIWAFIVIVKTDDLYYSILIPTFDQVDAVKRFMDFMQNDNELINTRLCRFADEQRKVEKNTHELHWLKQGILDDWDKQTNELS